MSILKSYEKFFIGAVMTAVFLLVGFFGLQSALAQSSGATTTAVVSAQVVATVEIYSAKIVSQKDNQFNLSFDFFNQKGVQPGIKYAVQLFKNNADGSQALVDEYVYPEIIDLKEGETKKMEIFYTAPDYLQGEFSLWLASKNSGGLPLAFSNLGKVELQGSGQFVEIIPETCFLTVEGETGNKKYLASQGISVKPEQNLIISCQVINHFSQDIKATTQFQTFLGTSFGVEAVVESAKQNETIELKPNQQKEVSFYLPKSNIPQAYEAKLWLVADNKPVSNKVVFHYAVAGQSATIENIILDKDFYKKGETAQIKLLWFAIDSQPGDQIRFVIKDQQGKLCSDIVNQSLDKQASFLTLASPIIRDCAGPKIEAAIKDQQGNVLDSKTFSVSAKQTTTTSPAGLWRRYEKIIFGAVIVLVLLLALIMTIRKKKSGKIVSLFIVLGFVIFFNFLFFFEAKATTVQFTPIGQTNCYVVDPSDPIPTPPCGANLWYLYFTSSLKDSFSPGEQATVTGVLTVNTMASGITIQELSYWVNINGADYKLADKWNIGSVGTYNLNSVFPYVQTTPNAPNTKYLASFYGSNKTCYNNGVTNKCSGVSSLTDPADLGGSIGVIPYTIVCVPLGSLGCSVPSDCCGSSSCSGGKCCLAENVACTHPGQADSQCCSGQCNSQSKCGPQTCFEDGLTCSSSGQCCTGYCNSQNKCGPPTCTENGYNCPSAPGQCCSGICSGGKCGASSCADNGDDCWDNSDCCSNQCNQDGICWYGCHANNAVCVYNWQCCSEYCTVADGNYGTRRCKNHDFYPCPSAGSYCSYSSPVGQRIYNSEGTLCLSGTLNTCPDPSTYCSNAVLFNSCGTRCPQGTKNITQPAYCDPPLGYISAQSNFGPIRLSLISVANFQSKYIGTLKVLWKLGQPPAAADLVAPTDPEASPVRVQTISGIKAWKKWWPAWVAPPASCLLAGAGCQYSDDCCAKTCSGGSCVCKSNTTACVKDIECCSWYCPVASKTCACIPMQSSITCQQNSQCCEQYCSASSHTCTCVPLASSCQAGNVCCAGTCTSGSCCLAAGESLYPITTSCPSSGYSVACCSKSCSYSSNRCN